MNWRDELMSALKNPERLKELAMLAKQRHETFVFAPPSTRSGSHISRDGFDYKLAQAGERQPGED